MKIIYQGDLHLRDKRPVNRIDPYSVTQLDKLVQLLTFAEMHDAVLLLGGDIFDTHKISSELLNKVITIFHSARIRTYACLGQHDVPYHDMDIMKSPVGVLEQAHCLDVPGLGPGPYRIGARKSGVVIHTVSWEQTPTAPELGAFNILLGHISVFEKTIPFYWKGEAYTSRTLRKKYPGFDLYLCGDIHIPFCKDGVVVSGSMMRQSIDQINMKPRCYLIDTETRDITPLYYTIKEDVFVIPEDKATPIIELEGLVKALRESAVGQASYRRDCIALVDEDKPVKNIIEEIFDDVD